MIFCSYTTDHTYVHVHNTAMIGANIIGYITYATTCQSLQYILLCEVRVHAVLLSNKITVKSKHKTACLHFIRFRLGEKPCTDLLADDLRPHEILLRQAQTHLLQHKPHLLLPLHRAISIHLRVMILTCIKVTIAQLTAWSTNKPIPIVKAMDSYQNSHSRTWNWYKPITSNKKITT